jgi:hypothetical protein
MLLFLFFAFVFSEKDCYYVPKQEMLPCVQLVDKNHDNILNSTEITNFLNLHNITQWKAESLLYLATGSFDNTTLTMSNWEEIENKNTIFQICMACKNQVHFW